MSCTSKLITFKIVIFILMLVSGECPSKCHCTKYKTFCFLAQLNTLPLALPNTTEHLSIKLDQIFQINTIIITYSGLHSLIHLELINVNLQKIQAGAFQNMSRLEYLAITGNNITLLKTNSFIYLENLYFLNLHSNEIFHLESGTFSGLSNLRHLYLARNYIIILNANVFKGMRTTSNCDIINIPIVYQHSSNYMKNKGKSKILVNLCSFTHFDAGHLVTKQIPNHIHSGMAVGFIPYIMITYKNIKPGSSGLLYLDLANAEISKLMTGTFENLKQLTYLDISNNYITEIPRGAFEGLFSLKVLKINKNNISSVNNGAFQGLVSLKWLEMINCTIITIENNTFEGLSKLQLLDLRDNPIYVLNNYTFSGLHMLKYIKLFLYDIQNIDKNTFSALRNLKSSSNTFKIGRSGFHQDVGEDHELDFYSERFVNYYPTWKIISYLKLFNNEKEISLNLTRLDSLEFFPYLCLPQDMQVLKSIHLFIDATRGNYQQDMLNLMKTLHYVKNFNITLVGVNSTEILKVFSEIEISSLALLHSDLKFLNNESFIGFSTSESLTLHDKNTYSIPKKTFHKMKSLTDLTFLHQSNVIFEKGSFYGLSNLTHLTIQYFPETSYSHEYNEISNCIKMGTFLELHNLKNITLTENLIDCLNPGAFHGLYNIEEINLSFNYIDKINAGVFGALCHEEFKLSCKNVTLPEYCNNTNALITLKYLDLTVNEITHIHPHAFIACNNLQTLHLSYNKFLTLDNFFLFTPMLKGLYMDLCNISNIPEDTFECTPLLSEIHFSMNKNLNKLTINSLLPLKHLEVINLLLTSLLCDCELYETWLWLHQHHVKYRSVAYEWNSDNKSYCGGTRETNSFVNMDCNITREQISVKKNFTNIGDDFEFFKLYIEPTVLIIILISGLANNGFLLFISLYHSDMRTKQNTLVIHLAMVDVLSLILNLPLSYWDTVNITWEFDDTLCKVFTITKDIMAGVVVLSVVILSIERFLVAKTFKNLNKACISERLPTFWLLIMTWLSGIVTSLPAYFSAVVVDGRCLYCHPGNQDYIRNVWTFQLLMYCLVPAVVITFLNIKTSLFLRESVRKIPGEIKNNICAQNRIMVANIVLILAAVFVISYLPNYILRVLVAWSIIDVENVFLPSFITFCLFFCNTMFNPISLFIMSSKFKSYILIYFPFLENK